MADRRKVPTLSELRKLARQVWPDAIDVAHTLGAWEVLGPGYVWRLQLSLWPACPARTGRVALAAALRALAKDSSNV